MGTGALFYVSLRVEATRLNKRAGLLAILVALILALGKFIIGLMSGSAAVLASALDSAFDLAVSSVNFVAIAASARPPDHEHRYGHGKAEALAGFTQALVIMAGAGFLIYRAVERFQQPAALNLLNETLYVMSLSFVLTGLLVWYQHRVSRKTGSIAVSADLLHYASDLFSNVLVIGGLLVYRYTNLLAADLISAIIVAIIIIYSSIKILHKSVNILIDRDQSDRYRSALKEIIDSNKQIIGYHDLRSRTSGHTDFVEIHLEMPKDLVLEQAHQLAEKVIHDLRDRFENLDIVIHCDPVETVSAHRHRLLDEEAPKFY